MYEGMFDACRGADGGGTVQSKAWVAAHNIASVFPNLWVGTGNIPPLAFHDLCIKSGGNTLVVTAIDSCADSDCSGCCTDNKGDADELIDLESSTDGRFGVADGPIRWADLGFTHVHGLNPLTKSCM
jgi:hypothetical protein